MTKIYRYPDDSKEDVKKLKRLAARVGRTFYDPQKHAVAIDKLRAFMQTLENQDLDYWRRVVMIDSRWCGATGQGAYWAVASRVVNEIAESLYMNPIKEK